MPTMILFSDVYIYVGANIFCYALDEVSYFCVVIQNMSILYVFI